MAEREDSSLHSNSVHWVEALNQASVDMDAAAANIQSTFRHASELARADRCAARFSVLDKALRMNTDTI
jgi:hypothetical protein